MTEYKDKDGVSGVSRYQIQDEAIIIEFKTGALYVYSYNCPGVMEVEDMKRLAVEGRGLNSYIATKVRKNYDERLA